MYIAIKELGEIITGNTPSKKEECYWDSEDICFIKPDGIADDGITIIKDSNEYLSERARKIARVVSKDAVFVTCIGSIGKIGIASTGDYAFNQQINVIVPNEKVLPKYLAYNLLFSKRRLVSIANAPVVPIINKTQFGNFILSIEESTDKQAVIVSMLDKLSVIIDARKKEIEELDYLIKARFVEMFGDCKLNPKGWNTVILNDIAEVGSSKRVFVEELQKSGIPFYRGTEVGALAEGKTVNPTLFITEAHYNELIDATGKPEIGDILMPSICPDGRIWIVDTKEPFYFKDGRVLWVHNIDKRFDSTFLLYTLKDRIITEYGSIASGTTFAELKIFALKQCHVFDVPHELQNNFAAFVAQVDKSKAVAQKALDQAQLLFDSLMQKYFG